MKQNRGAAGLLILAEIIILTAAVVLGAARKLNLTGTDGKPVQETGAGSMDGGVVPGAQEEVFSADNGAEAPADESGGADAGETEVFSAEVEQKLSEMTLEEKVAQLFIVSPEELTGNDLVNIAGAGTKSAIDRYPVGGLVYTRDNYQGREQFRDLLTKAGQYSYERSGLYLFLAVQGADEAGNAVTVMSQNYEAAWFVEMMAADRMTGENILQISTFPEQRENITAETPWVMMSNQTAVGIAEAEDEPCSFSAEAVEELRNTTGYPGVILTGNLSEETVMAGYSAAEAAVSAVQAGADMLYCPADFEEAFQAVFAAVEAGKITEDKINRAVGHILTQKLAISTSVAVEEPDGETAGDNVGGEAAPEATDGDNTAADENAGDNTAAAGAGENAGDNAAAENGMNGQEAGNDAAAENAGNDGAGA